jgi:transcriptional regulator with XRE-family HTH domain
MKQSELADELKISNSYLSEIESGKKQPTVELLQRYAEFFKMPASTFLLLSERMGNKGAASKAQQKNTDRVLNFLDWVLDDDDEVEKRRGARA